METNLQKLPRKEKKEEETSITQIIEKYNDVLEAEQLQALPLLGYGMSASKTARYIGVSQERVRMWINADPNFRAAIQEFKEYKQAYHQTMLDQAGVLAWDKVFAYLSLDIDASDDKTMRVQADIAKFIISQLSLKTQKSEIMHEVHPQLHVTEDSAALIARKLKELQNDGGTDIIDSEYRIALDNLPPDQDELSGMSVARAIDAFDGKDYNAEIEEIKNEQSSAYVMHPSCTYGKLEYDETRQKWHCHICGRWTLDLVVHIRTEHKLSPARYRKMYGLDDGVKFYVERPNFATDDALEETQEPAEETQEGIEGTNI